jgi:type IV pilus assembly protein PilM
MLAEAVKREARRILPVPLEQLYLTWQTIPSSDGKIRVFLVAVPCTTVDALLKVLCQVGLKPDLMDIKPFLLSRVVKETTAVIVDVQPTEFDIVIMADGVPHPIRTIPLPREAATWQQKLPIIRDELDRTIKFYNSSNPESPLLSGVPIFASGVLADEPELRQSLSDDLGHPVVLLSAPLQKYPVGLDPRRYLVNIGLVLKKLSSGRAGGTPVINLDVLPVPYQPKPLSLTKVLALPGAAIAIGLLVFLLIFVQSTSADIASMRGQLNTTSQLLQQELSQRQELMQEITEAEAPHDSFIRALGSLEKQSNIINGDLEVTVNSLPSQISLSSINYDNSVLTIQGRAPSEQGILSYLENLDTSGRFWEMTVTNMRRIEGEGMDFTLILKTKKGD